DARFFVRADMQKPLAEFRPLLARLTFHEQLGTMLDKADRIEQLAVQLGAALGLSDADSATARRAAQLAKADLATSMVVEMTSLQGVMGREYALHSGESADVAAAIEQHYWPVGAGGVLPESPAATAVALADRFDSLAGLFGAGLAPTGSADPFGLRRAALGIVQILIGNEIDFDVRAALQAAAALQPIDIPAAVVADAGEFIIRRLRSVLQEAGFRHDVVEAVARAQGHNPHRAGQAAAQLAEWVVRPDWDTTLDNYARCVRITRDLETRLPVTSDLFVEDAERSLRAALESAAEQTSPASSVDEFLTAFGALVPSIMRFFDEVLVMADDEAVRNNRLGLLQSVAALADGIVDLSALEGF
ncbi:MAG: glycine--tRNA ligase subunit beta, partial [Anaerolineales bacterium]